MKRTAFAITVLLLLLPGTFMAQTIGGRIGVTRSTQTDADGVTGFIVGGFARFPLHRNFGLQSEVLFSKKGSGSLSQSLSTDPVTGALVVVEQKSEFDISYIDVPILATLRIPLSAGPIVHFVGGPTLSFELGCDWNVSTRVFSISSGQQLASFDTPLDCPGSFPKKTDHGLTLGTGIGFAVSRTVVEIDVRYSIGLADTDPGVSDIRNRVLALTIGVGLLLGR